ncbi:MAG: hypothetical protein K2N88_08515 [Muribaculaceae bacterium]|nr:hypothetical protein [Muribaculaceae bacterium]
MKLYNLSMDSVQRQAVRKVVCIAGGSLMLAAVLIACNKAGNSGIPAADTASEIQPEDFHADNDIAMTVRSIVDALRVGEPLDTLDYNFNGVLTDGIGRPLYTTMQGRPGTWDIDVLSPDMIVIRNEDIGDLLPDDLENYLMESLELTAADLIDSLEYHGPEGAETSVYDFDGGFLRIDTRTEATASGLEGALVRISATRDLPSPRQK